MEIGQSAGKSFAYLLGVYLGDGCITTHGSRIAFKLNTIDLDFAEATRRALIDFGCEWIKIYSYPVKKSSKPNHQLIGIYPALTIRLKEETGAKAHLPNMDSWSRDMKLAFIGGLMDSEGYVAEQKANPTNRRFFMAFKSCDPWVPEFARLMQEVGINIGKVCPQKPYKAGYKVPIRFTIKMGSWIKAGAKFSIARKQRRVEEWNSAGPYERRSRYPRRLTSETLRQAVPAEPMIKSDLTAKA